MASSDAKATAAADEVLIGLAARHGGIEPLLRTFFSFLHRKTDFYVAFPPGTPNARMGFAEGQAEAMLLKAFRSFPYKPLPASAASPSAPPSSSAPVSPSAPMQPAAPRPAAARDAKPTVQYTEEGKQVIHLFNIVPIGNGGATDHYYWTQTLQETTVYVDVPSGTKSKDVRCEFGGVDQLSLCVKGSKLLEGELGGVVRPSECLWTLEGRGSTLVLSLEKGKPAWWRSVLKGDPEIDTSQVDSTAKVTDYDGETQGALRKIMFDQQQKAQGLPTSDELQMQALLEKAKLLPGSPFLKKEGEGGGGGGGGSA